MTGRVMSLLAVVLLGGMAAGGPIAGWAAAATGPQAPFVLGAVACGAALGVLRTPAPTPRPMQESGRLEFKS